MTPKKPANPAPDALDAPPELFAGDTGTLPLPARKALVLLLKHTHIVAGAHPEEWHALNEHEEAITTVLHNVFLELVMDPSRELAYKRQAAQGQDARFPTLLRNRAYTRDEVAMLLHLRESYRTAMYRGDAAAYVDETELLEAARLVRPESIKDHVAADKTSRTAVKRLFEDRLLQRPRDTAEPDRYRVSPVIETVLTVDRLQAFSDALAADNAPAPTTDGEGEGVPDAATEQAPDEDVPNGLDDAALEGDPDDDFDDHDSSNALDDSTIDDDSDAGPGLFDAEPATVGVRAPQFQAAPTRATQTDAPSEDATA